MISFRKSRKLLVKNFGKKQNCFATYIYQRLRLLFTVTAVLTLLNLVILFKTRQNWRIHEINGTRVEHGLWLWPTCKNQNDYAKEVSRGIVPSTLHNDPGTRSRVPQMNEYHYKGAGEESSTYLYAQHTI